MGTDDLFPSHEMCFKTCVKTNYQIIVSIFMNNLFYPPPLVFYPVTPMDICSLYIFEQDVVARRQWRVATQYRRQVTRTCTFYSYFPGTNEGNSAVAIPYLYREPAAARCVNIYIRIIRVSHSSASARVV